MTPDTQQKPKRPQPAKDGSSLFVVREQLGLRYSLKPPTPEQDAILRSANIHVWPGYHEFKNTPAVQEVLKAMTLNWSESKGKA